MFGCVGSVRHLSSAFRYYSGRHQDSGYVIGAWTAPGIEWLNSERLMIQVPIGPAPITPSKTGDDPRHCEVTSFETTTVNATTLEQIEGWSLLIVNLSFFSALFSK